KPLDDRVAQIEHHVSRRKRVDVVPTQRYFPKVLLQACEIHWPPVTPRIELPMQPHADPVFRAIDAILAMEMDLGGLLSCAQRENGRVPFRDQPPPGLQYLLFVHEQADIVEILEREIIRAASRLGGTPERNRGNPVRLQ